MLFTSKQPKSSAHTRRPPRLLFMQGGDKYSSKTKSTVEPCFENAYYPIALRYADLESASRAYMDMAAAILRRICGSLAIPDKEQTEVEREEEEVVVEPQTKEDPVEDTHTELGDEARDAIAFAQPVSVPPDEPELELFQSLSAATSVHDLHNAARDQESDSDSDTDSESGSSYGEADVSSDSSSAESASSSVVYRHPLRRSPLAQSNDGLYASVYAGYHCTIEGCGFSASTQQHVRHHMVTASHWYLLEVAEG